jgi:asparagine synthase (glutamine-hydrolysing)
MCGIAGIIYWGTDQPVYSSIKNMNQTLHHRGPDQQEFKLLQGCHLGHTRLSIIDLNSGNQPMSDEDGVFLMEKYIIIKL